VVIIAQLSQYNYVSRTLSDNAFDSAHLRVTYSLSYISDSLKPNQVWEDKKILLIGDSMQHFYSAYQRLNDSARTAATKQGRVNFKQLSFPDNIRYEGYDIYSFPITKTRSVMEQITDLSLYRYREEMEILQWKIGVDTCTILSYKCQKATTRFRGRDWIVWFSMEIPINAGPWKLCGLPGLILKAYDNREHYNFECIGLENISKKKQPIIMIRGTFGDFIECTRQDYMKAQRQFYENYSNSLLSLGYDIFVLDDSGNKLEFIETPNTKFQERTGGSWFRSISVRDRNKKIPYNPIELE
jgi:GLPGLI family protein